MNLYMMLREELESASCFSRPEHPFLYEMLFVSFAYLVGYSWILSAPSLMANIVLLLGTAFVVVQAGFISHEASHNGISTDRKLNYIAGQFFLTLLTGVSYSWFRHSHQRHHADPKDPTTPKLYSDTLSLFLRASKSLPRALHKTLLWSLAVFRGFGLHIDSLRYLYLEQKKTHVDQLLLLLHFMAWLVLPAIILGVPAALLNYILLNLFAGMYIGPLLLLSHTSHPPVQPKMGSKRRNSMLHNLGTTRNLNNSTFMELIFKGTREHVEHHLFPTIPEANLRRASEITRAFCQRHGLVHSEMDLTKVLKRISQRAAYTQH